ncbi:MAG: type I phosphomannose isomerase catalytic subunit [Myxococcota bacterium]
MLRFEPQYEALPWGGRRLEFEFSRHLPEGPVGESWELVDLDERQSLVADGPRQGATLGELWREGALGGSAKDAFPFLLKWLDTNDKLSVQVHPEAEACERLGKGSPKTEAWYVAHAEPGATLMAGHYPGFDQATLKQAAKGGTIHKWLYESNPRVGDLLLVPAGTLHSIGPGFLFLEVQQPSDTTFRVYDWDRVGLDGNPRELHVEEACASVNFERHGALQSNRDEVVGPCFAMRGLHRGSEIEAGPLRVVVAESAAIKLSTEQGEQVLEYGDVAVLEPADGTVVVATGTCLLLTEP